jgi:hypothetical protein
MFQDDDDEEEEDVSEGACKRTSRDAAGPARTAVA